MTTAVAAAIIAAIGVLSTILGLCGKAIWELAKKVQHSADVSDEATAALKELPETLKTYDRRLTTLEHCAELQQDTLHRVASATNSINRRVCALEMVIGSQNPDALGIAQAAAEDQDSAVHIVSPPKEKTKP